VTRKKYDACELEMGDYSSGNGCGEIGICQQKWKALMGIFSLLFFFFLFSFFFFFFCGILLVVLELTGSR